MVQRDFFAFCKSLRLVELKAIGTLSAVKHFGENEVVYSADDDDKELSRPSRAKAPARNRSATATARPVKAAGNSRHLGR